MKEFPPSRNDWYLTVIFCYIYTYRAYGNGYGYPPQQGPPYGYPQQNGYNYGYNPQLPPNYSQGTMIWLTANAQNI